MQTAARILPSFSNAAVYFDAIFNALGAAGVDVDVKWQLIQRAGTPEFVRGLWVQAAGIEPAPLRALLDAVTLHGKLPEGTARALDRGRSDARREQRAGVMGAQPGWYDFLRPSRSVAVLASRRR